MKTANNCPKCGTYRAPSGNINESELCETRQELRIQREIAIQFEAGAALLIVRAEQAEAELAESDRVLAIHKRDFAAHFKAHQDELAKLEKALESLESIAEGAWIEPHWDGRMMICSGMGLGCFADDAPELAEWLKNKESKNV
ncbi:MAG: hypothetical protein ACEQSB_06390 [Undibacterium sp.]